MILFKLFVSVILLFNFIPFLEGAQPKDGTVKIHFICHSHCDLGWLNTVDQYYDMYVNSVLTTTTTELSQNPNRTFIWSEIGYLDKWWRKTTDEYKTNFTRLVNNGQIEFINGGYVQNDEACPTVEAVIRHLSDGHKFIIDTFGKRFLPTSGWQIDPFGHSSLTATIQAQMGYKHVVLDRIHWELKNKLKAEQGLEFLWRGSPNTLGPKSDIFAHVLDDFYIAPQPFHFEFPIGLPVDEYANKMIELGETRKSYFKTPHILLPLGGDFNYRMAMLWYSNLDPLIEAVNKRFENGQSKVQVAYSNLTTYFKETIEWLEEHKVPLDYHDGDFFPYADKDKSYWTGYYTSRPWLKGLSRSITSKLRETEIFSTYQNEDLSADIIDASYNCSILQHHDAITGTARSEVVQDYSDRLRYAEKQLNGLLSKTMTNIAKDMSEIDLSATSVSDYPKIEVFEQAKNTLVFSNSLTWQRDEIYSIRVKYTPSLHELLVCPLSVAQDKPENIIHSDCSIRTIKRIDLPNSPEETYAQIDFPISVAPLGLRTYFIDNHDSKLLSKSKIVKSLSTIPYNTISNSHYSYQFSSNGFLVSIKDILSNLTTMVEHKVMIYKDIGGSYMFLSEGEPKDFKDEFKIEYFAGDYLRELRLSSNNMVINLRVYNTPLESLNKLLHYEYLTKGVDGQQTMIRFVSDLKSESMYSDNGLELISRKVAADPNTPQNFLYPSISISMIEDEYKQVAFACIGDRSKAAGAMHIGQMEFAIHRSLTVDDQKGLDVPAIDNSWVYIKSNCYAGFSGKVWKTVRSEAISMDNPIRLYNVKSTDQSKTFKFTGLNRLIPENIHILSMEQSKSKSSQEIKIRLMNHDVTSAPTTLDIKSLFHFRSTGNSIHIVEEFNLNNEVPYSETSRINPIAFKFTNTSIIDKQDHFVSQYPYRYTPIQSKYLVTLLPLEIKSFSIKIDNKN